MAIGLSYDNLKQWLGGGSSSVGTFGNGLNDSYDSDQGAFYGGSYDDVEIVAKKETPVPDEKKKSPWLIVVIVLAVLVAGWIVYKKVLR